MVEVLVEHEYIAKEPGELSIAKGDIIHDVVKKPGGWWEGTLNEKKGLFPDNFVRVIDKDATITTTVVLRNRKDAARIRQCRVVFSYKQDHEDELNLNVGDIIDILGEEEEGWWRGLLNGKQGVFPSNFVEEIAHKPKISSKENPTDLPDVNSITPALPAKAHKILCEVKFNYKAQNEDELSLKEGDFVTLISKDGQDPGWWKGELNGVLGVFPDNFVTVLPHDEKHSNRIDDRKLKQQIVDVGPLKPSAISAQRKSLENNNERNMESGDVEKNKTTPPVPGKKPSIPIKKSPSSGGSGGGGGGLFFGKKKKMFVDVTDGIGSSKSASPPKTDINSENSDNVFDDVVRRPLLADVRATRPKAPGRRPPSVIFKEMEPGVMNGNTEHTSMDNVLTDSGTFELDAAENKPKLREWEKHKAPWLEEMKLNQAKRTSTSPGPDNKLKLTPTDKAAGGECDETKLKTSPFEKESSPIDKSSFSRGSKTPPNELLEKTPILRNKINVPTMPPRPQTIQTISNLNEPKCRIAANLRVSPTNKTPSPQQKYAIEKNNDLKMESSELISHKQYTDLIERIIKLEEMIEKQNHDIEELKRKLQIETDMRIALQAKLELV